MAARLPGDGFALLAHSSKATGRRKLVLLSARFRRFDLISAPDPSQMAVFRRARRLARICRPRSLYGRAERASSRLEALRLDAQLARQCHFRFWVPGQTPERLQLVADGAIGPGSNSDRRNWYSEVDAGEIRLIFCDAFGPRWRFTREVDGRWSGRSLSDPSIEAYLVADARHGAASEDARSFVNAQWPGHLSYSSREEAGA